ncbi:MAG: glycosyltransferase family 2 protein [Candidatus Omnitrophica bacterium]|nr:glycosyltransferase family 2 protein [Candidatus Omnitrophota bacterium]
MSRKDFQGEGAAPQGASPTVVIIARNEEANIAEALKSAHGWAGEIIVVDDNSIDRTAVISAQYARVLKRHMENEGIHRNWAYAQARTDWVLSLDADEQLTPELRDEIMRTIQTTSHVAFDIPLRNFIGTYWVRFGGWYPAPKVRLFRRDRFKYEEVQVHPRVVVDGTVGHLTADIIHKGYPDIEHFLASVNRQTTLEAQKWIATGRKMSCGHMLWRAIDRFFRRYVGKQGFRDGMYGFLIAYFDSLYQFLSYVKYRDMVRKGSQ